MLTQPAEWLIYISPIWQWILILGASV